jgi:methyl-accepting chemotaxis protein
LARKISDLARSLSERTREVASAAQSISASSQNLSASVSEQAASLQETASALEQMGSMIHSSSENAARSAEASKKSHELAGTGRDSMDQLIGAMSEIKSGSEIILERVDQGNTKITGIVNLIQEIGQKTKIINDIVFQTKLLSFNASVEAARAGEHGKGFSVVAEEVGNLAQMSGTAAKEISTLLESSTHRVEEIVRETRSLVEQEARRGRDKVEKGTGVATHCREILEQIFEGTGSVQAMVTEISGATRQQSQGIQEINKAMSQLDQATQQNSNISQIGASAAVQLTAQSEQLEKLVSQLQAAVFGERSDLSEPPSTPSVELNESTPGPKFEVKPEIKVEPKVEVKPVQTERKASSVTKPVDPGLGVPNSNDPRFEDL